MRNSRYGKGTKFFWEASQKGLKSTHGISLIETESTHEISQGMQEKINNEWGKVLRENKVAFDSPKWRYEFAYDDGKELSIFLSPTTYSVHNVMRHEQNQPVCFYPNPMTINTVQLTADGYIPLGIKSKADQDGLGLLGAGFIERYQDENGVSYEPENLGYIVQKECMEETKYDRKQTFTMNNARLMALVFGSNHDTTAGFYLPLFAKHTEVEPGNEEHSDIVFLKNKPGNIEEVLKNGGYKGIEATDHLLGCLEAYLNCNKKEQLG